MTRSHVLDAVDAIYGTTLAPERWPIALQTIASVFGADGAILAYKEFGGGIAKITSQVSVPSDGGNLEHKSSIDQVASRASVEIHSLKPARLRPNQPQHKVALRRGTAINRIPLPINASELVPADDPNSGVRLFLTGVPEQINYTNEDKNLFRQIREHVIHAVKIGRDVQTAEVGSNGLKLALDRLGVGCVVLDQFERVVSANSAARLMIGGNLADDERNLPVLAKELNAELEYALRRLLPDPSRVLEGSPRHLLVPRDGKRPLVVYGWRLGGKLTPEKSFLSRAHLLLVLMEPDVVAPDPAVVRDLLGVTLGEAKVAALVAMGASLRQAAETLGIAEETARTVMKRTYAKSGVTRQSEMAALLSRLSAG